MFVHLFDHDQNVQTKTAMKPKSTKSVTANIILETRRPRKGDSSNEKETRYPVMLRITYDRKFSGYVINYKPEKIGSDFSDIQKYWISRFDKGISLTKQEFADLYNMWTDEERGDRKNHKGEKANNEMKDKATNKREPFKTLFLYLTTYEREAMETALKLSPFTFEGFKAAYFEAPTDKQDVFVAIRKKADGLRKDSKITTAELHQSTLNALEDFTHTTKLNFDKVTPEFLKKFEKYLYSRTVGKQGRTLSKTTVSMYLRSLRSVWNESAPDGISYPFGKKGYHVPQWNESKRALTQEEVSKIANYSCPEGSPIEKARDYWLFSFLCNGLNFRDMANLKYSNIVDDTIVFERQKTAHNNKSKQIQIVITKLIGRILDLYGNNPKTPDNYVFNVLSPGMTAEKQHTTVKQLVKTTNKYMKRICADLEIPQALTYSARHSFASILMNSGASVEFISKSLGHSNIRTTQNYLGGFEKAIQRQWAETLENSIKPK